MDPIDDGFDLTAETTEQALARVEAECGWSDVRRFPDAWEPAKAAAAAPAERNGG